MNVKRFQIKQEETIIKEECIPVPEPRCSFVSPTHTVPPLGNPFKIDSISNPYKYDDHDYLKSTTDEPPNKCSFTVYMHCFENKTSKCKINDQQKYFCAHCVFSTKSKQNLKIHLNAHLKRESFLCDRCGFNTLYSNSLKQHLQVFTAEKPHHCKLCNYKIVWKDSLNLPNDEKPYHCTQCDYKTLNRYVLKRHSLVHTGEKPHHSKQCDYKTARRIPCNISSRQSIKESEIYMHTPTW